MEALERLGGIGDRQALLALTTRRRLRAAVRDQHIRRVSRGRYALPTAADARVAATRLSGMLCLRSAAAHHGWELKTQPPLPEIAVDPRRRIAKERRTGVQVRWMPVGADDAEAGLDVEPQAEVDLGTGRVHPDLVARAGRLAIEADSWSFHVGRKAHRRDCVRYNLLVLRGWRVLRFTWEQVMHEQAYVRWALRQVTAPDPVARVEQDEAGQSLPRSA